MTAATEYDNDGEDDNPSTVIVKDAAEAIAIHICLSFQGMFLCESFTH